MTRKMACWLVFNARGTVRASKRAPELKGGEYAIKIRLEVPDSVFLPDAATVDVKVPERAIVKPTVVVEKP